PFAAILVVWFENELLAVFSNIGYQVNYLVMIASTTMFNETCPGDMGIDGFSFFGGEEAGVAFVAQDSQAGFLVQDLAAERIDHAYRPIAYCAHNRLIEATPFDKFTDQHALIDQGNVEITGDEASIAVFYLAGVGNDTLQAL